MTTRAETETILRWDREMEEATFYTADPREARRWRRLGYDVRVCGTVAAGRARSWQATVPVAAVALLALKGGQVHMPHWLEPPVVRDDALKAQGPREPEKTRENAKENRAVLPRREQTAAGRAPLGAGSPGALFE